MPQQRNSAEPKIVKIKRRTVATGLFVLLALALFFLPSFLSSWIGEVVSIKNATGELTVDRAALKTELHADRQDLPWATVYTLAKIANAAYQDWPNDEKQAKRSDFLTWGFKSVLPIVGKKQYAYVLSDDDVVVVAFRGTDDWDDVKKDAWCAPDSWHEGKIHDGFQQALDDVKDKVVSAMQAQGVAKKRLWVTGHSLGGAMAAAFGYDCLVRLGIPPAGVVTFGQPRSFDRKVGELIAEKLHGKYVRFINEDDLVPWLPPPTMGIVLADYVHVGTRFHFNGGKISFLDSTTMCAAPAEGVDAAAFDFENRISADQYGRLEKEIHETQMPKQAPAMPEEPTAKTSLHSLARGIPQLNDHLMESYLSNIEKYSHQKNEGEDLPDIASEPAEPQPPGDL